jgi:hypothetical protein
MQASFGRAAQTWRGNMLETDAAVPRRRGQWSGRDGCLHIVDAGYSPQRCFSGSLARRRAMREGASSS